MQIGGKVKQRQRKPTKPQYVVQLAAHLNEYATLNLDDKGLLQIQWIGDPHAATKFNSKYEAKTRVRDIEDVPSSRVFKELEVRKEAAR